MRSESLRRRARSALLDRFGIDARALGAFRVALGLLVVAVLASPAPYFVGTFGLAYLAVVLPADAVMLYATVESFEDPTAGQSHIKYGMFLAAASFVVGRATVVIG